MFNLNFCSFDKLENVAIEKQNLLVLLLVACELFERLLDKLLGGPSCIDSKNQFWFFREVWSLRVASAKHGFLRHSFS